MSFIIEGYDLYHTHLTKTKLYIHYEGRRNIAEVVWDPHSKTTKIPTRIIRNMNIVPAM